MCYKGRFKCNVVNRLRFYFISTTLYYQYYPPTKIAGGARGTPPPPLSMATGLARMPANCAWKNFGITELCTEYRESGYSTCYWPETYLISALKPRTI